MHSIVIIVNNTVLPTSKLLRLDLDCSHPQKKSLCDRSELLANTTVVAGL